MKYIILFLVSLTLPTMSLAKIKADEIITYKEVDGISLKLHAFYPPEHTASLDKPAIIFFFGGGWKAGKPQQFYPQSQYFASRGIVTFSAEYRVENKHKTSPKEAVKDAKSAVRWLKTHAKRFGINPDKIIAGGGSAGGHLAAATATIRSMNEPGEDSTISAIPSALVLFNPVFDNGPGGYGFSRVEKYWEDISPLHNITEKTPPTIVFLGTKDQHIPVSTAEKYKAIMEEKGRRCDLFIYKNQKHGFFNNTKYKETLQEADNFLVSLGYLKPIDLGTASNAVAK